MPVTVLDFCAHMEIHRVQYLDKEILVHQLIHTFNQFLSNLQTTAVAGASTLLKIPRKFLKP